jgi:SAM-dependent methyltransferase
MMDRVVRRPEVDWQPICDRISHGCIPSEGKRAVYRSGYEMLRLIQSAGGWKPGDRVLDVGSGNGRIAIPLCEQPGYYLGLEPIKECVAFCEYAFAPWRHLRFQHFDVRNGMYNPTGEIDPEKVRFPVPDASVDVVLFCSIFSHAERLEVCAQNLAEAWRSLAPLGKCWTTWFTSPPNAVTADASRTVFPVREIVDLFSGWRILSSNRGRTTEYHDQWTVLLEKP